MCAPLGSPDYARVAPNDSGGPKIAMLVTELVVGAFDLFGPGPLPLLPGESRAEKWPLNNDFAVGSGVGLGP
jgi:hypothetical protein